MCPLRNILFSKVSKKSMDMFLSAFEATSLHWNQDEMIFQSVCCVVLCLLVRLEKHRQRLQIPQKRQELPGAKKGRVCKPPDTQITHIPAFRAYTQITPSYIVSTSTRRINLKIHKRPHSPISIMFNSLQLPLPIKCQSTFLAYIILSSRALFCSEDTCLCAQSQTTRGYSACKPSRLF